MGDIKLNIGDDGFGMLLGAGASFRAGYPLMDGLTSSIIKNLEYDEIKMVSQLVHQESGIELNIDKGKPNIEIIADLIEVAITTLGNYNGTCQKLVELRQKIRQAIVGTIEKIREPCLEDHIKLLKGLKRIYAGRPSSIWIFTTNYDLVIEYAASLAGFPLYDGFNGSCLRYFDTSTLTSKRGNLRYSDKKPVFSIMNVPNIKLIKLHGSINWWNDAFNNTYTSDSNLTLPIDAKQTMILPRRTKALEILEHPYDKLWRLATDVIGRECRFLTTIGYSFNDQHLNEVLLKPKLLNKSIRVNALVKERSSIIDELNYQPNFKLVDELDEHSLWDFKLFAQHVSRIAGLE